MSLFFVLKYGAGVFDWLCSVKTFLCFDLSLGVWKSEILSWLVALKLSAVQTGTQPAVRAVGATAAATNRVQTASKCQNKLQVQTVQLVNFGREH